MNKCNLEDVNGEIWENHHSATIELWSQDEIRFGLEVGLHRTWQWGNRGRRCLAGGV